MFEWEGTLPEIDVIREDSGAWLYWSYCIISDEQRRMEVRVEIPFTRKDVDEWEWSGAECEGWLYLDGDPLIQDTELTWDEAEAQCGAKTRLRLLEKYRAAILANEPDGLAALRQAATAMGLFGQPEGRIRRTP